MEAGGGEAEGTQVRHLGRPRSRRMVRRRQRDKQWTQTFRQEGKRLGMLAAAR
jgi:hypothetical protein